MPMTPIGLGTRRMRKPFGRTHSSVRPVSGSGRAAISSSLDPGGGQRQPVAKRVSAGIRGDVLAVGRLDRGRVVAQRHRGGAQPGVPRGGRQPCEHPRRGARGGGGIGECQVGREGLRVHDYARPNLD
jgi:hypothetical protein